MFPEMTVLESIMLAISHRLNITFQLFTNLNSNIKILNEAFEIIKNIGLDKYLNSIAINEDYEKASGFKALD